MSVTRDIQEGYFYATDGTMFKGNAFKTLIFKRLIKRLVCKQLYKLSLEEFKEKQTQLLLQLPKEKVKILAFESEMEIISKARNTFGSIVSFNLSLLGVMIAFAAYYGVYETNFMYLPISISEIGFIAFTSGVLCVLFQNIVISTIERREKILVYHNFRLKCIQEMIENSNKSPA